MKNLAQTLLIYNARLFTPIHPGLTGWLLVEHEHIRSVGFGNPPNFSEHAFMRSLDAHGITYYPVSSICTFMEPWGMN